MKASTGSRTRLSAEERRAQIIAAAKEVFIEQGLNGARSRLIAERAGITEAYLYRHFHSKEDIYQLAVDVPLRELIDHLGREIHDLARRDDVSRADVLLRSHQILLECIVEIAPLIVAALFSDTSPDHGFYARRLFPSLRAAIIDIIPDITGWPIEAFEIDVFVEAMLGLHLTIALEHLLEQKPVDVPVVARELTMMFAAGLPSGGAKPRTKERTARADGRRPKRGSG